MIRRFKVRQVRILMGLEADTNEDWAEKAYLQQADEEGCRLKYMQRITDVERDVIHNTYFQTADKARQRDFIVNHVTKMPKGRAW